MKKIVFGLLLFILGSKSFSQNLKTFTAQSGDESDYQSIMVSLDGGCSLACADIFWTFKTTSYLANDKENTYVPINMEDGEKNTAWIEGKEDDGIGEKIIITFNQHETKRKIPFDGIYLTNGYAKSQDVWENNSRVKIFKVYLNGKVQFLIKLQDCIYPQSVNWGRNFLVKGGDVVELEILEVYKGNKYKDTAISDLSLEGAH